MRNFSFALLALVTLGAAGCGSSFPPGYGQPSYTDAGCRVGCDKCVGKTICISAPYDSTCLEMCTKSSDCATGEKCAILDVAASTIGGCVSPTRPMWCSPEACNIAPKCKDAMTALVPLPFKTQVCGWEIVPCVNGCDATTQQCK
jgi:hypothetical protein